MNLSWKLGTFFKIPVRLHISMLLIPWLLYDRFSVDLVGTTITVLLLAMSVLLHEFGHALTGRRFGVHTQDIILTPIGGMARMTNMPTNPRMEIAIAIAGPLVSAGLAGIAFALSIVLHPILPIQTFATLAWVFWINLMLAVFNLIPALPMDGGRVLRGLLARKRDHLSATKIAVTVSRVIAVAGGVFGFVYTDSFNIPIIAAFIYFSAGSELRMATMHEYQRQAAQKGEGMAQNPFFRMWTSGGGFSPRGPGQPQKKPEDWTSPVDNPQTRARYDNWDQSPPENGDGKIIIEGEAEVISRKEPDKESKE